MSGSPLAGNAPEPSPGAFLHTDHVRKLHAGLAAFWMILTIPAVLWWSESVTFLVFASLYANVAAHFSAYQGARAERAANGD